MSQYYCFLLLIFLSDIATQAETLDTKNWQISDVNQIDDFGRAVCLYSYLSLS